MESAWEKTLVFALVAKGTTILCSYKNPKQPNSSSSTSPRLVSHTCDNYLSICQCILGRIPKIDSRMSYGYERFLFHYIVENGLVFMVVGTENFGKRIPFCYLEDIKTRFKRKYLTPYTPCPCSSASSCGGPGRLDHSDLLDSHPDCSSSPGSQRLNGLFSSPPEMDLSALHETVCQDFISILRVQLEFYSSDPSLDRVRQRNAQTELDLLSHSVRTTNRGLPSSPVLPHRPEHGGQPPDGDGNDDDSEGGEGTTEGDAFLSGGRRQADTEDEGDENRRHFGRARLALYRILMVLTCRVAILLLLIVLVVVFVVLLFQGQVKNAGQRMQARFSFL